MDTMSRAVSLLVPACMFLAACGPKGIGPGGGRAPARGTLHAAEPGEPAWPPEEPRIAFVHSFSTPEQLGIRPRLPERVVALIAGRAERRLVRPMAVVVVADIVYVADPGAKGVHRFDLARRRYDLIRGGEPLPSPVGLAVGPGGSIYVADSMLAAVFAIDPRSTVARRVPLREPLGQPTGLAFDPASQRLFVVDTADHRVKVFEKNGSLAFSFGGRGDGDGEFNYPTHLWRDGEGRLLVTDSLNFRIQVFDGSGGFLGKFGRNGNGAGEFARPKGVAADRFGHVYVVDALFHAVQVFDSAGQLLLRFGSQGREPGEFWLPSGVCFAGGDTLYVADSYNQRIQIFRYVGSEP